MSVLVVLGLVWAAVLVPPMMRARAERRAEFIDSFRDQMGALGDKARAGQALVAERDEAPRPRRVTSPVQRRRDILGGLLGAMIGSLVLGAIPRLRMVWILHLFLLNLFIAYVALLAHNRARADRRTAEDPSRAARAPAPLRVKGGRMPKPALAPVLNSSVVSRR